MKRQRFEANKKISILADCSELVKNNTIRSMKALAEQLQSTKNIKVNNLNLWCWGNNERDKWLEDKDNYPNANLVSFFDFMGDIKRSKINERTKYEKKEKFSHLLNCWSKVKNNPDSINSIKKLAEQMDITIKYNTLKNWIEKEISDYLKKGDKYTHRNLIPFLEWAQKLKYSKKPAIESADPDEDPISYLNGRYKSFLKENIDLNNLRAWLITNYLETIHPTKLDGVNKDTLCKILENCLDSLGQSTRKLTYPNLIDAHRLKLNDSKLRYRISEFAEHINKVENYCEIYIQTYLQSNNLENDACIDWIHAIRWEINLMKNQMSKLKQPPDCSGKLHKESSHQEKKKAHPKYSEKQKASIFKKCVFILSKWSNEIGTIEELATQLKMPRETLGTFLRQFKRQFAEWKQYPSLRETNLNPLLEWINSGRSEIMRQRKAAMRESEIDKFFENKPKDSSSPPSFLNYKSVFFQIESVSTDTLSDRSSRSLNRLGETKK